MSYTAALKMPSSYAVMNEEEMTYLEGGNGWYNERDFIAKAIDVGLIAVSGGMAIHGAYAIKNFIKVNRRKIVKNVTKTLLSHFPTVAGATVSAAIDMALTVAGTSVGEVIAYGLDYADGNLNGYVFG